MKQGVRPGAEMRCALLEKCFKLNIHGAELEALVDPMAGKPDKEKERIAAELIEKLDAENS